MTSVTCHLRASPSSQSFRDFSVRPAARPPRSSRAAAQPRGHGAAEQRSRGAAEPRTPPREGERRGWTAAGATGFRGEMAAPAPSAEGGEGGVAAHLLEDNARSIPFADLCRCMADIAAEPKAWRKADIFLSDSLYRRLDGQSMWPVVRLLLPKHDEERQFMMRETKLSALYAELFGFTATSKERARLKHFARQSKSGGTRGVGALSNAIYEVMLPRTSKTTGKTVGWVNDQLDALAAKKTARDGKKDVLRGIEQCLDATEQMWFSAIVLKIMRHGLSDTVLLNKVHPAGAKAVEDVYTLKEKLEKLSDPSVSRQPGNPVALGRRFRPMLAARERGALFSVVLQRMRAKPFVCDLKIDGERIMVHKSGDRVEYFTRNGNDYTELYGPQMSEWIRRSVRCESAILDGEMCSWDCALGEMVPFGSNRTVAREDRDETGRQLFYIPFDCVLLEGDGADDVIDRARAALTNLSAGGARSRFAAPTGEELRAGCIAQAALAERRCVLEALVEDAPKRVEVVKHLDVYDRDAKARRRKLLGYFEDAWRREEEGLVVKDLLSPYVVNSRAHWVKMKPDDAGLGETLDLVVIGCWFSRAARSGRRGKAAMFLLALRDDGAAAEEPRRYVPFCRVGSGLSDAQVEEVHELLSPHWEPFDEKAHPACWSPWPKPRSLLRPDVVVPPSRSLVFEVLCTEITDSEDYPARRTLRFPRILRVRADLNAEEAHPLSHVAQDRDARLRAQDGRERPPGAPPPAVPLKRPRRSRPAAARPSVPEHLRVDAGGRAPGGAGSAFGGAEICVAAGDYRGLELPGAAGGGGRAALVALLAEHGASVVANPARGSTRFVVCSERDGARPPVALRNLIDSGSYNVVNHRWAIACVEQRRMVDVHFDHAVHLVGDLRGRLADAFGTFGLPQRGTVTREEVSRALDAARRAGAERRGPSGAPDALLRFPGRMLHDRSRWYHFFGEHLPREEAAEVFALRWRAAFAGAQVADSAEDGRLTHLVVHEAMEDAARDTVERLRGRGAEVEVVTAAWVEREMGRPL